MAEPKTKKTETSVAAFLDRVKDEDRRADCLALVEMLRQATKCEPKMWGASIVGFGAYHYVYPSGREGDWFLAGFSPRKDGLTVYIMSGFAPFTAELEKLGKFKTGKSCLYLKSLADVDRKVLKKLCVESVKMTRKMHR